MFELKDNRVIVSPNTLALPFFKVLWDIDKTKYKDEVFKQFLYIYYLVDFKSPYSSYPEDERRNRIIKDIIKTPDFKESEELKEAIEKYKELNRTTSLDLLESVRGLLYKSKEYFNSVQFDANGDATDELSKAAKVIDSAGKLGKLIETLNLLEEKVKKELTQKGARRGGVETAEFEIPD